MSIGETLKEARDKKGISIREAADATKIRGDFLASLEDDSMDIMLPQIYIRGFLKNYAKFLKIDPKNLLADFDVIHGGESQTAISESHERLGRINLPDTEVESDVHEAEKEVQSDDPYAWLPSDKTFYYKLALLLGGGVVLVFLLGLLIQLFFSDGGEHEINPELADNVPSAASAAVQTLEEETFSLIALNDVIVIVEQLIDKKRLFSGTIRKNETVVLKKTGRIKISFTEGDDLVVEKNDLKFNMGVSGIGTRTLD